MPACCLDGVVLIGNLSHALAAAGAPHMPACCLDGVVLIGNLSHALAAAGAPHMPACCLDWRLGPGTCAWSTRFDG
jgi:arginine exporter protein ArgO